MADNYWNQFDKPASPGPAGGGSGADYWDQFDGPDRGITGDLAAGVAHSGVSLRSMAGGAQKFVGRAADAAGDALNSDMLHGIGSHLMAAGTDMQNAATASENAGNTLGFEGQNSTLRRNAYGVADMGAQMGMVGGAGALAGAAAGAMFGGVGALPGAILGWGIANVAALPGLLGLSQASSTADRVEAQALKEGKSADQAKHDALVSGALTGTETAAGAAAIGALGPVAKLVGGAATGAVVETALRATAKDVALDTAKATGLGAAANVGQTAAIEGTEKAYDVGEGPTAQGLIDAGIQGAAITGLTHAPGAALRASSAGRFTGPLLDPQADRDARQKAALGAMAVIASRDPALAKDFGLYAQNQITYGLPIEIGNDRLYTKFGEDAAAQAAGQSPEQLDAAYRATKQQSPSFVPTGDEAAAFAPDHVTNPDLQPGGPTAGDADMQAANAPAPQTPEGQPSWLTAAQNPTLPPVVQSAPPSITDTIGTIMHSGSIDEAVHNAEQSIGGSAADMIQKVNAFGEAAGVITPEGAEATPSAANLAADQTYFEQQRRDAAIDLARQQQAQPPAVPEDAFAQREAQRQAEADALKAPELSQIQQQGNLLREQAAARAERRAQAQTDAVAQANAPAAAVPAESTNAMSRALQGSLDRVTTRMGEGKPVSTLELGMVAEHHQDPAVREQAQNLLSQRRNKDIVQPAPVEQPGARAVEAQENEQIGGRPGLTTLGPDGTMAQGEPNAPLFASAKAKAVAAAAAAARVKANTPVVDARVQPLQDAITRRETQLLGKSSSTVEHVDPSTLPDVRTPVDNGVKGSETLSKKEYELVKAAAAPYNKNVVLFRQKGGENGFHANGFVDRSDPNTIYLNADVAGSHHMTVLGHEMAHQMRINAPELFHGLRNELLKLQDGSKAQGFLEDLLGKKMTPKEAVSFLKDNAQADWATEEWVADLVGGRFTEYRTWQQTFGSIGKGNRGLVYRIADFITKFIDHLLAHGGFGKKDGTDQLVTDLQATRQAIRRGLAAFAEQEGGKAMAHEAAQLRAGAENRIAATEPTKLVEPVSNDRAVVGKAPDRAAPAPVAERPLSDAQGSRAVEPVEPPKQYGNAPQTVATTEDAGLTVAGQQRAAAQAAEAAAPAEKPTPPTPRRAIEQPQVVREAKLKEAPQPWQKSEYADRIRAMRDSLLGVDSEQTRGMWKVIEAGVNGDIRSGRGIREAELAFREQKAREVIADAGVKQPVEFKPFTAEALGEKEAAYKQLPKPIVDTAVGKLNEMGEKLAALGYDDFQRVSKLAPADAQALAQQMREVYTSLMHLAPERYRSEKGHQNASPAKLARMESHASEVLGIDTTQHPGIKTDVPLTAGGVRSGFKPAEPKAEESREETQAEFKQRIKAEIKAELAAEREQKAQAEAEAALKRSEAAKRGTATRAKADALDTSKHSMMQAIAKLGGMNKAEAAKLWGDRNGNIAPYFHRLQRAFTSNGRSVDEMRQTMADRGYVKTDAHGKADIQDFDNKVTDGLAGIEHYHDDAKIRQAEEAQREDYEQRPQSAGYGDLSDVVPDQSAEYEQAMRDEQTRRDAIDAGYNDLPEHVQDVVAEEHHDEINEKPLTAAEEAEFADRADPDDAPDFDAEPNSSQSDADSEFGYEPTREALVRPDRASDAGRAETGDGRAAGDEPGTAAPRGEEFGLTPESQAAGEARLAREEADRAEQARQNRDADRKAQADAMRGEFRLTGSDRDADANPDQEPLFSGVLGRHLGDLNADQEAAVRNVLDVDRKSVREKWQDYKTGLGRRLEQGIAHRYAALKDVSPEAHLQARLARGSDGALEANLLYGKVFVDDSGAYDVKVNPKGGFANVLRKLGGEHNRFFLWIAAHRAEDLTAQQRERLFKGADIDALKTLDKGREAKFAEALKEYQDYNNAILDISMKSGEIDQAMRDKLASHMYVPFYRALEDQKGPAGPRNVAGLVNQYFSKTLKGGEGKLNDDLLANVMQNWSHLLGSAARNRAARTAMAAGENLGIVEHVKNPEAATKNAVKVMVDGKAEYYEVHDPMLLNAVSAMYAEVPKWMNSLSAFKRALTFGVTAMPGFKVRNLVRDTLTSIAISPHISANPLENIRSGWEGTAHDSQTRASMLASGGMIRFGNLSKEGDASRTHRLVMAGVPRDTILDTPGKLKMLADKMRDRWDQYAELGDRSENINRAALYKRMIAEGHSHAEASFAARDLLDFSDGGTNPVVQFLVQSVPFLNARIQGLFKIGESMSNPETRKRFYAVAGTVVMASLANLLMYQNDKDFKAREDWDRDNYWWFKVGGTAFRIPKPFELGAIGTTAERMWELHSDPSMTAGRFTHVVGKMIGSQFNLDPTPQIIKPLSDVYANRDSFTERPIESQSMQKMQPQDRYSPNTSMLARALGSLPIPEPRKLLVNSTFERLSPVQWDALLKGYFGGMGQFISDVADAGVRPAMGLPSGAKPTFGFDNALKTASMGFLQPIEGQQTRYMTDFYDQLQSVEQAHNSWREAIRTGQPDKARQILADNRQLISAYTMAETVKRRESALNVMARRIQNSTTMDDDTKQARLQSVQQQRNQLALQMSQRLSQRINQ